jgi:DNA-directed RNA polymerase subunit L
VLTVKTEGRDPLDALADASRRVQETARSFRDAFETAA